MYVPVALIADSADAEFGLYHTIGKVIQFPTICEAYFPPELYRNEASQLQQ